MVSKDISVPSLWHISFTMPMQAQEYHINASKLKITLQYNKYSSDPNLRKEQVFQIFYCLGSLQESQLSEVIKPDWNKSKRSSRSSNGKGEYKR